MNTMNQTDQIIQACNKTDWKHSLGAILLLPEADRNLLMEEVYAQRMDIRFGDSLICACQKWQELGLNRY